MITINLSTADMLESFTNKLVAFGKPSSNVIEKLDTIEKYLTNGNADGIRMAFLQGYNEYLLTYDIQQIVEICFNENKKIRDLQINIFHEGNLICSLVNQEIFEK